MEKSNFFLNLAMNFKRYYIDLVPTTVILAANNNDNNNNWPRHLPQGMIFGLRLV